MQGDAVPGEAMPGDAASGDAAPGGVVANGAVASSAVANGAAPNGAVPNGVMPNGAVPNGALPSGVTPTGAVPGDVISAAAGGVDQPAGTGAASAPVVAARDVTIVYPAGAEAVVALRNFSLAIQPGEIVGLIGEAACGKTTAALAMLGLLRPPGRVLSGSVTIDGQDLFTLGGDTLRALRGKDVGLIVQSPRGALNPLLPIGRQIATVYRAHNKVSRRDARAHAVAMLRRVGINDPERRYHAFPHEISGGMAQRVLIAMAVGAGPRLLVADEPTSGLDVTIQAQFLDELARTARATGSAVLLMTQDLGIIANYCDRVMVMQAGAIVADSETRSFFAAPSDEYSRTVLALRHAPPPAAPSDPAPLLHVDGLTKHFPL
ncbi:MAG TPA: ATP-binding cassette domain-containing protein, partial [Rhodopila sp.]